MRKIIEALALFLIVIFVLLIVLYILSYKPKNIETIDITNNKTSQLSLHKEYAISTFNIGYCGNDKDTDFFMDGGKGALAESKEKVLNNYSGIVETLKEKQSDFFFIQEVDTDSKRSYNINQLNLINKDFNNYSSAFAYNHKVPWIPIPMTNPTGKVESGFVTLSKYKISNANRHSYPNMDKGPTSMFKNKKAFIECRIEIDNGKELVLLNTHNTAFDNKGDIRREELKELIGFMKEEYEKGNYVIAGGDYNMILPGTGNEFQSAEEKLERFITFHSDLLMQEVKVGVDKTIPTARSLKNKYIKGQNFVAVVDGFLVSDNVDILYVKCNNDEFTYTDHNLVEMKFKLK